MASRRRHRRASLNRITALPPPTSPPDSPVLANLSLAHAASSRRNPGAKLGMIAPYPEEKNQSVMSGLTSSHPSNSMAELGVGGPVSGGVDPAFPSNPSPPSSPTAGSAMVGSARPMRMISPDRMHFIPTSIPETKEEEETPEQWARRFQEEEKSRLRFENSGRFVMGAQAFMCVTLVRAIGLPARRILAPSLVFQPHSNSFLLLEQWLMEYYNTEHGWLPVDCNFPPSVHGSFPLSFYPGANLASAPAPLYVVAYREPDIPLQDHMVVIPFCSGRLKLLSN
eukprot:TRINITY_DN1809_c0_g1_i3.p1 TRINITY_DN1809_c0_g1~~TRINITY_DN1809_c0_g1_i3.p1  ORF type:complete len:282 (+),score=39.91 TRINITY_DN1809_c0_g1_i3:336-1181(+)